MPQLWQRRSREDSGRALDDSGQAEPATSVDVQEAPGYLLEKDVIISVS